MAHSVTFAGTTPYASDGRAYADLYCHGTAKVSTPVHLIARIDTGADHLVMPILSNADMNALGLGNISSYPTASVYTANGLATAYVVKPFYVDIQGKVVPVEAHFMPSVNLALLGLHAVLTSIDIGFDVTQWMHK